MGQAICNCRDCNSNDAKTGNGVTETLVVKQVPTLTCNALLLDPLGLSNQSQTNGYGGLSSSSKVGEDSREPLAEAVSTADNGQPSLNRGVSFNMEPCVVGSAIPESAGCESCNTAQSSHTGSVGTWSREPWTPLVITIDSARNLRNADLSCLPCRRNLSDPYCIIQIEGKPLSRSVTEMVRDNLNPVWNHSARFADFEAGDRLVFTVYDQDMKIKSDDFLGRAFLTSDMFYPDGFDGEIELLESGGKKAYLKVGIHPVPSSGGFRRRSVLSRRSLCSSGSRGSSARDAASLTFGKVLTGESKASSLLSSAKSSSSAKSFPPSGRQDSGGQDMAGSEVEEPQDGTPEQMDSAFSTRVTVHSYARCKPSGNNNKPADYIWLKHCLDHVAANQGMMLQCKGQKGVPVTPVLFLIGSCKNYFCEMQAMMFVVDSKSKLDFWWVKPSKKTPDIIENETLTRQDAGKHKNSPGRSGPVYQPLADLLQDGLQAGEWCFGLKTVACAGEEVVRAFVYHEMAPREVLYICFLWQEDFTLNPFASSKYIKGKIVYQRDPDVTEFFARQYEIIDGAMEIADFEEGPTTSVLPDDSIKVLYDISAP